MSQILLTEWLQEEVLAKSFTGWDFSYLDSRMQEELPPWDYLATVANLMQDADSVLDMGTGGGERLLELRPFWPAKVSATEEYAPNLALSRQRLEPLGAQVFKVKLGRTDILPFENGEFDLVMNRHSGLSCNEVARILSAEGVFITQQVHGLWAQDLLAVFGAKPQWPDSTLPKYLSCLENAGLVIQAYEDWQGSLYFHDVGAIVFYLLAVPWLVPEFNVQGHLDSLYNLQQQLESQKVLKFAAHKYIILAKKLPDGKLYLESGEFSTQKNQNLLKYK